MMQESLKNEAAAPENALARETTRQKILELVGRLLDNCGSAPYSNSVDMNNNIKK